MTARFRRRRVRETLFLLLFAFSVVTPRAAGLREIVIPADSRGPRILARLWTPCAAPPAPIIVASEAGPLTIQALENCATVSERLPLIVISHGLFGDAFSHHDTAAFLADHGFAVVTLEHTLDSVSAIGGTSADSISSFLVRPVDVTRVIDFLLANPDAGVSIDSRRLGFFGFSRGGYTGLVLAGAVPDFLAPPFPCPEEFLMCRQIRDNDIPDHASGYDPRIRAFVIADPVNFFPNRPNLEGVTAPIQLWSSEHGGMGVRPEDVAALVGNLPTSPEFHRPPDSEHFAFLFPCPSEVATASPQLCTNRPGFDRADFHRQLNAQVLAFFRRNLPGSDGQSDHGADHTTIPPA